MQIKKYSTILTFFFIIVTVFLFHSSALNLGFAFQEFHYYVHATANGFYDVINQVIGFSANASEYRPINHYIFFLVNRSIFGDNPSVFHLVILLLNCVNGLLIYIFISKISKSKLIGFFSVFIFFTRVAILRSFYATHLSPPKFCFFLLLTFIFYLKSEENKKLFLPLSVIAYVLAMFTRETFVFTIVPIAAYELIYKFDCKISVNSIKLILKKIAPYIMVIIGYIIIRMPYILGKAALSEISQKDGIKIGYKSLSIKYYLTNLINYIRFYYNALTFPFAELSFSKMKFGLIDIVLFCTLIAVAHLIYSIVRAQKLPVFLTDNKKTFLFGGVWFLIFISLVCFFGHMNMDYLYVPSIGFCFIMASVMEHYYDLLVKQQAVLGGGLVVILLISFIVGFYFFSRTKYKEDDFLMGWERAESFIASIKKDYPSIGPDSSVHYFGPDIYKYDLLMSSGNLFRYVYDNKDLNVMCHKLELDKSKIKPGDIVFKLEHDKIMAVVPGS